MPTDIEEVTHYGYPCVHGSRAAARVALALRAALVVSDHEPGLVVLVNRVEPDACGQDKIAIDLTVQEVAIVCLKPVVGALPDVSRRLPARRA